ncbi:phospholipid transporting ATPase [Mitosporidium daphniae]
MPSHSISSSSVSYTDSNEIYSTSEADYDTSTDEEGVAEIPSCASNNFDADNSASGSHSPIRNSGKIQETSLHQDHTAYPAEKDKASGTPKAKRSLIRLKDKQTKKMMRLVTKTRNWFDGVPTEKLNRPANFNAYVLSSTLSFQQLSDLSTMAGSSTCSHKLTSASFSVQGEPDQSSLNSVEQEIADRRCIDCIGGNSSDSKFCSNEVHSTKYNLFTFIPKNLYEQFHRLANVYFLLLVVLQFIPAISSYNPLLSAGPLLFILMATGIKDAVEDYRRHKADRLINESWATILEPISSADQSDHFKKRKVAWKDIKVGDVIYLRSGDSIPADCVALSSSSRSEIYLDTMSLDGETNLKIKRAIPIHDSFSLKSLRIEIDPPSPHLYSFSGKVFFENECNTNEEVLLTQEHILLRGCITKNTDWVIGVVLYTGYETKIMLNSIAHQKVNSPTSSAEGSPSKRSTIERQLNRQILLNFLLLLILCLVCMSVESFSITSTKLLLETTTLSSVVVSFFSSLILFQTVVPIALYITVEICKTIHAFLIHSDLAMKDPISGKQCNARAWNLSDDLGRVQFIFSDKTGTLTKNIMRFKYLWAGGQIYSSNGDGLLFLKNAPLASKESAMPSDSPHYRLIMLCIALCHSVLPSANEVQFSPHSSSDTIALHPTRIEQKKASNPASTALGQTVEDVFIYSGESPDEVALVTACAEMGYQFKGTSGVSSPYCGAVSKTASVAIVDGLEDLFKEQPSASSPKVGEQQSFVENYEVILTIPFSSERQRMGVLVRLKEKAYFFCKGSDSAIIALCRKDDASVQNSSSNLAHWASQGLRILCFAMKEYDVLSDEWKSLMIKYEEVKNVSAKNSACRSEEFYSNLESGLCFLGITAVEDSLQDGVADAIESFREARICTWVLTGDKAETAVNVSTSAGLITSSMKLIEILFSNLEQPLEEKCVSLQEDKDQHELQLSRSSSSSSSSSSCNKSGCAVRFSLLRTLEDFYSNSKENMSMAEGTLFSPNPVTATPVSPLIQSHTTSPFSYFSNIASPMQNMKSPNSLLPNSPKSILSTHYQGAALVVDGMTLKYILDSPDDTLKLLFLSVALRCSSVICSRVAPLQKAMIVGLVKEYLSTAVCLSIGDGANDVSMLRKADIGIGISTGKEGCQAVMAADYSISQFSHLKRLLLVHGRWSYHRISSATLSCFYKNIAFVFVLFWYQFDCAFSSQFIYDYAFLLFYNFLFSILPVLSLGIFDRDIESNIAMLFPCMYTGGNKVPKCVQSHPHSHFSTGKSELAFDPIFQPVSYYSIERFLIAVSEGVYQSLVCYLIPRFVYSGGPLNTLFMHSSWTLDWIPVPEDRTVVGSAMAFCIITTVNLTILLCHYSWTLLTLFSVMISLVILLVTFFIMASWTTSTLYGTPWILFFQPAFYLCMFCCILLCISPRIIFGFIKSIFYPTSMHVLNRALVLLKKKALHREHSKPSPASDSNQQSCTI